MSNDDSLSQSDSTPETAGSFEDLADIAIPVELRLAARRMSVRDLARLRVGDKLAMSERRERTVDVFVGEVRLGDAEAVVDDGLSARIVSIDVGDTHAGCSATGA